MKSKLTKSLNLKFLSKNYNNGNNNLTRSMSLFYLILNQIIKVKKINRMMKNKKMKTFGHSFLYLIQMEK
jgi:hypothetical protein